MGLELSKKKEWMFLITMFLSCFICVGTITFYCVLNEVYELFPLGTANAMTSSLNLTVCISAFIIPWICNKIGSKNVMILGSLCYAVGVFTFSIENSVYVFAMLIISSFGVAIANVVGTIMIADVYKDLGRRNKVLGWYMIAMGGAGTFFGVIAGYLGQHVWKHAFYINFLGILFLVMTILFVPSELNQISLAKASEKKNTAEKASVHLGKSFWILCILMAVSKMFCDISSNFVSIYIEENALGNATLLSGYFSSVIQLSGAIVGLIYGFIYKKVKRNTGALAILSSTCAYLLLAIHPCVPLMMLSAVLSGFTLTVNFSYFFAIAPTVVPKEKSDLAIGILQAALYSVCLTPYLVTFLEGFTGQLFTPVCWIAMVVLGIMTVLLFIACNKLELPENV